MMVEEMKAIPLIPVLRKIPYESSKEIVDALVNGGIKAIEFTMDTDRVDLIIQETMERYGQSLLIGIGTVLDLEDCRQALNMGVQFIVAPILDERVVRFANEHNILCIPGVFTPSEMQKAYCLGASIIKLFPASALGPSFIKDVKGPLTHIDIMTTGGITLDSVKKYITSGASIIGVGSSLVKKEFIERSDWRGLTREVEKWIEEVSLVKKM